MLRAYSRQAETGRTGASLAAMGLADLAIYRGRFDEAVGILAASIQEDEAAGNQVFAAGKYIALAEAYQGSDDAARALDAVARALELRRREEVLVPAARVLVWAQRPDEAEELASELESELEAQARGYGRIIRGELALERGRTVEALEAFESAQALVDAWLVRFEIGRLYVGAGRYAEALTELELCMSRSGEVAAIFLDDVPTYRYLAPLPYWLGRAPGRAWV